MNLKLHTLYIVGQIICDIKWLCQFIRIEIGFVAKQSPFFKVKTQCSFNQPLFIILILSLDICVKEEIVAYNTTTGITILHLFIVAENGRLQRTIDCWSIMAVFHGFEGEFMLLPCHFVSLEEDTIPISLEIRFDKYFLIISLQQNTRQKILHLFIFKLRALWFI